MKRIIVVGPSGAGKSTFSRRLSKRLGIDVYHLDNIFRKSDKSHITRDEFDLKLSEVLAKDSWIIDGDYSRTYEVRFKNADTIIFLNYPLEVCLEGVNSRIGTIREDIPWVEDEFDPEFLEWIKNWFKDVLPKTLELIEKYKDEKNIIIFKSRDEALDYLNNL